ncbi:MAG: tetratricopeptide repeat protein, partial [bacterium]
AATGADDAGAVQVNPAAIADRRAPIVSAFMKPEIAGQTTGSLGYAQATPFGTVAGTLTYKTLGDLSFYYYDEATGKFPFKTVNAGSDLVIAGSFARRAWRDLRAGGTLKLLHSSLLGTFSANAVAMDLGARMPLPLEGASAGVVIRNAGIGLKFVDVSAPLPLEARAGGAIRRAWGDIAAGGALDAGYGVATKALGVGAGVEGTWRRMVSLRLGYRYGSALRALDVGLGVAWNGARLDYVLEPLGEGVGMNHGVSLSYRFGPEPAVETIDAAAESPATQQAFAPAVTPAPSPADQEYAEASRLYAAGDYDGAWGHAYKAIQADPSRADAWQVIGNCQMTKGDKAGALQSYRASLQLNPNNPALKAWVDQNP